ncbi:hypothetical protein TWF788_005079 [Orbilia oligospora]|uniref:Rhodopsin domain-containing protein n=1 Tax=Orbilia oligospora TaxID=2813651 RepID=A0A7C8P5J3_ORBOL|nr:hypothetical protein TWF788_005079 [Orbilia oligospora]
MGDIDTTWFSGHVHLNTAGNYSWSRPASWPSMDLELLRVAFNEILSKGELEAKLSGMLLQNPETRGPKLLSIATVFTSLAFLTVALRVYTRARLTRYMGWDDWFIMLAMAASFGLYGLQIAAMNAGWYHHIWDVPYEQFVITKKIGLSIQSLYPWILGFMKISILLFYLRLSVSPPFRLVVYITLGFMALYTVASSMAILFQCWPFNTRLGDPTGSCVNFIALNYTIASLNIATDVFVYLLSWVMVRHLKVSTGQKIVVLVIFSVGALVCIFSGLRFYYLRDYWNSSDPTWVAYSVSAMSSLEANVAIITSSAPAVKPLVIRLFPRCKFLNTIQGSAEGTYCGFSHTPDNGGSGPGTVGGDAKKFESKVDTTVLIPPFESHTTTMVGSNIHSNIGRSRRELSDEDLGFPDGFDGKCGPPPNNWDDHAPAGPSTPGSSHAGMRFAEHTPVPRIGQRASDMGWVDREISMASDGMDLESFKKGNMNARMDLVDALRGGPVGIIPEPPGGSRRQSEAPFSHFYNQ